MNKTAALIVNGKSRRGREWFSQVEQTLRDAGFDLVVSHLHRDPKQVMPDIKAAIDKKIPIVCVGGGDGTLSGGAKYFVGSESVMGVLPLGTGNSLARDLGIKADVQTACETILNGREELIDVGEVNGDTFLNVSTVGFSGLVAENLDDQMKKKLGRAVYLVAMFKALAKMRRFHATVELADGNKLDFETLQVVIGNGRYHAGPFPITPDASIESGYLSGYSVNTSKKGVLFRYMLRMWHGRHVDMDEVVPFQSTAIQLTTSPTKKIVVDGEMRLRTPASYRVMPSALRVLVPSDVEL